MKICDNIVVFGDVRPKGYSDEVIRDDILTMAAEIESIFGPASTTLSLRFINFSQTHKFPCIYYPNGYPDNLGINITGVALNDIILARFQLSHELVHCLCPVQREPTLMIEEGMATRYQLGYIKKHSKRKDWLCGEESKRYKNALSCYRDLVSNNKGAIKRLRAVEPCINLWSHKTFQDANIRVSSELEEKLLTVF